MITIDEIAQDALHAVGSGAGEIAAVKWTVQRYRHIANRARLRHLRVVSEVTIPGLITSGTADVTRGSREVSGDATALAAWAAAGDMTGKFFRVDLAWYEVDRYDSGSSLLLLKNAYVEASNATGSYALAQRYVTLAQDTQWLAPMLVLPRRHDVITLVPAHRLEERWPQRHIQEGGPFIAAEISRDPHNGAVRLEFYPYSSDDEMIRYMYWRSPSDLKGEDPLPSPVIADLVKEGVIIDIMRWEGARAARDGRIDEAAWWRNEMRAQNTVWERQDVAIAAEADAAVPDSEMLLEMFGPQMRPDDFDPVRSAFDEVYRSFG